MCNRRKFRRRDHRHFRNWDLISTSVLGGETVTVERLCLSTHTQILHSRYILLSFVVKSRDVVHMTRPFQAVSFIPGGMRSLLSEGFRLDRDGRLLIGRYLADPFVVHGRKYLDSEFLGGQDFDCPSSIHPRRDSKNLAGVHDTVAI